MVIGARSLKKGTIGSIVQFNHRMAPPGTRYSYASIEPEVLGMVLHSATNESASDYLQEKVWQPIGVEADAKWLVDAEGFELAHLAGPSLGATSSGVRPAAHRHANGR